MNECTDKERSLKLYKLGFEEWDKRADIYIQYYDENGKLQDTVPEKIPISWKCEVIPAYSAETLFKWLRDNTRNVCGFDYSTPISPMLGMSVAKFNTGNDVVLGDVIHITFKTSLADMLADAIICILSQEKV
jgi:hypothetical protein